MMIKVGYCVAGMVQSRWIKLVSQRVHIRNEDSCLNVNWVYPDLIMSRSKSDPFVRYLKKYRFDSMEGWSNDPNWINDKVFAVPGVNSAFLLIHRNTFSKVGGYDENFPFAGFEDHDISERLKKMGVPMYVDPTNIIFHNEEDRINLENWLERKRRGAITRKVAVTRGYKDLELNYHFPKESVNKIVYDQRKTLLSILKNWPGTHNLDFLYFLTVNRMLAAYTYAGYTQSN